MNKKILLGMMMIGLVAALAGAGMYAYFSDTETSTGNTFTAGTCDIELEAGSSVDAFWTADDMKPGDEVTGELIIRNKGTVSIKYLPMDIDIVAGRNTQLVGYLNVIEIYGYWWTGTDWSSGTSNYWSPGNPSLIYLCDDRYAGDPCDDNWMEADFGSGISPSAQGVDLLTFKPGDAIKLVFTMEFEETGGDQNAAMGESVTVGFTFNAFTDYGCSS